MGWSLPHAWRLSLPALAFLVSLAAAPSAPAEDLSVTVTAVSPRLITFEVSLLAKPVEKILSSLDEGVPTRVAYTVELWQRRALWFDRLVQPGEVRFTLSYDAWSQGYLVESDDLTSRSFAAREDLVRWLEIHGPLELGLDAPLPESPTYYLAVAARVAPLGAEQVGAVEKWLGGGRGKTPAPPEEPAPGDAPKQGVKGYVMRFVLDLSGLGELTVTGRSPAFHAGPAGPAGGAGG